MNHFLYLSSTDLDYFPENYTAFIDASREQGLLGDADPKHGPEHYFVGEDFLQLVSFLGCSPYLKVYPESEDDSSYCTVSVPGNAQPVRFLASEQVSSPRCPHCRKAIQSANKLATELQKQITESTVDCPHCNKSCSIYELDWRKNAGFVSFYIAISNIFPKEAIPNQALLDWLQSISGCEWKYFYI